MLWSRWFKWLKSWHVAALLSGVTVITSFVFLRDAAWIVTATLSSGWALVYLGFFWAKSAQHAARAEPLGKSFRYWQGPLYWLPLGAIGIAVVIGIYTGYFSSGALGVCANPAAIAYTLGETWLLCLGTALCMFSAGAIQVLLGLGWAYADGKKTMFFVGLTFTVSSAVFLAVTLVVMPGGVTSVFRC